MKRDDKWEFKVFKFMSFVLSTLVIMLNLFVMSVNGESNHEVKVIKVACVTEKGYFEILEDGTYYGYGFEYLNQVKKYIDYDFEYVFGTIDECIDMIKNGKADIMPMICKLETNLDDFEVSDYSFCKSNLCLVSKENKKYAYEKFDDFEGMKVGLLDWGGEEENIVIVIILLRIRYFIKT